MDYFSITMGAIGGGAGGFIGVLLAKKVKNQTTKMIVMIVPILILSQLGNVVAKNQNFRDKISSPTRFEKFAREAGTAVVENEKYRHLIQGKSLTEVKAFFHEKSKLGLRRLSLEDLAEWHRLRTILSKNSKALCAGFWTGRIFPQDIASGMETLNDTDLKAWLRISMSAAVSEIEGGEIPSFPGTSLQDGIGEISGKMNPADQVKLSEIMAMGTRASDEEACWALQALLEGGNSLSDQQRVNFLRALAAL